MPAGWRRARLPPFALNVIACDENALYLPCNQQKHLTMKKILFPILLLPLLAAGCKDDDESVVYQTLTRSMTVDVATAGSLPTLISGEAKNDVQELTLTGRLNGTDIAYLREMAGADELGDRTEGSLRRLDLSAAYIVEGGDPYYRKANTKYETENNIIGDHFFDGCKSLVKVVLPTSAVRVGDAAFNECYLLTSVQLTTGVVEIGDDAFRYCHELETVNLPLGLQVVGDRAFEGCYRLQSIDLPVGMATVGAEAFQDCSSVTKVSLPQGVQTVGYGAFAGCMALSEVRCEAVMPPTCQTGAFESVNHDVCKLFVPRGSKDVYAQAPEWKEFKYIIEE